MFRKNTAGQYIHFQGVDAATGGIKSGVSWTVRRCIDGTFAAATGTVNEDGTAGWYNLALSQADTNGSNIGFNFTGTGAVPQTVNIVTTVLDPTSTAFGLSLAKTTNLTGLNDIAATAIVSSGAITTSGGAVSTVTNLTNAPTNGDLTATMKTSVTTAATAATPTAAAVTGDVGGKVLGGGASALTGTGVRAVDASGNAIAPAATALTNATWTDAKAADLDAAISTRSTYAGGAVASVTGAVGSVTAAVTVGTNNDKTGYQLSSAGVDDILRTALTEGYAADGVAPTLEQAIFELVAFFTERSKSGTTLTVNKLDGITPAMTFTLNSATAPTSLTRAT